jgi:hypothetical protein
MRLNGVEMGGMGKIVGRPSGPHPEGSGDPIGGDACVVPEAQLSQDAGTGEEAQTV